MDIIIKRPTERNPDVRMKISELERETEKLDKIKNRFNETMHKSIKLAQFNYNASNPELGVLESNFPSTVNSVLQSHIVSRAVSPSLWKRASRWPLMSQNLLRKMIRTSLASCSL